MIQHPKDVARPESTVPGANGSVASPRSAQGAPGQGVRATSPPCLIQRQVQMDTSSSAFTVSAIKVHSSLGGAWLP